MASGDGKLRHRPHLAVVSRSYQLDARLRYHLCSSGQIHAPQTLPAYRPLRFQDKADDILIGVKSTAIRFGDKTRHWLSGFGAAMIASLALSGYNVGLAWPFYAGLGMTAAQIGWQVSEDP